MKTRNKYARAVRDPSGPYRGSVVPNKKAYSKSTRNIWRKNLKGLRKGMTGRVPPCGILGGGQKESPASASRHPRGNQTGRAMP